MMELHKKGKKKGLGFPQALEAVVYHLHTTGKSIHAISIQAECLLGWKQKELHWQVPAWSRINALALSLDVLNQKAFMNNRSAGQHKQGQDGDWGAKWMCLLLTWKRRALAKILSTPGAVGSQHIELNSCLSSLYIHLMITILASQAICLWGM